MYSQSYYHFQFRKMTTMRSFALTTFALLISTSDFLLVLTSGASLATKWAIEGPPETKIMGDTYWVAYNISDSMKVGNINASIRESKCQMHGRELFPADGISNVGSVIDSTGKGSIYFDFDVGTLRKNANVFTGVEEDGANINAGIKVCVKYMLISNDYVVNSAELDLSMSIAMHVNLGLNDPDGSDSSDGSDVAVSFNVDGKGESSGAVDGEGGSSGTGSAFSVETSYSVVSYICEPAFPGVPLTDATYSQGSVVSVCVTPDPNSRSQGIVIDEIDWFIWNRNSTKQIAIEDGLPAENLLTHYQCAPGSEICSFSSVLYADFFSNGNGKRKLRSGDPDGASRRHLSTTSAVEGSGVAKLMFRNGDNSRSLTGDGRVLQSSGFDSVFKLSVGIQTRDDQYALLSRRTITAGGSSASTGTSLFALGLFLGSYILLI